MDDVKELALNFEAVKVSMSQDKNGTNLRLCIHPDDVPQELHQHWVGSRYMVAMVKLNDENEPELSEDQVRRQRLFKSDLKKDNDALTKFENMLLDYRDYTELP